MNSWDPIENSDEESSKMKKVMRKMNMTTNKRLKMISNAIN